MFTGIVKGTLAVSKIDVKDQFISLYFDFPHDWINRLELGASVAINGACLTVKSIDGQSVGFDVIDETLRLTNLGELQPGTLVNIERAARFDDEIGGHLLSGHISGLIEIIDIQKTETNCAVFFKIPEKFKEYLLPKGYVGLNGASLTIGEEVSETFSVHLIPETLKLTTFGMAKIGDKINLEIDSQTQAVVDTVKRVMAQRK